MVDTTPARQDLVGNQVQVKWLKVAMDWVPATEEAVREHPRATRRWFDAKVETQNNRTGMVRVRYDDARTTRTGGSTPAGTQQEHQMLQENKDDAVEWRLR